MNKYTLTTLKDLKPGDLFLKENDPHEIIYEVLEAKCTYKGLLYVKKGDLKMWDMLGQNQSVIFLKHGK